MVYNRKGTAPWSIDREAGVESSTVDSNIEVPQYVQPTINSGFVDETGKWKGNLSSDEVFKIRSVDEAIANGATILTPTTNADGSWPLDMSGYRHLVMAIFTTEGGNYALNAVMGPQDASDGYGGLTPVNAATLLRTNLTGYSNFSNAFSDSSESLTADVWNIFMITETCHDQKLLQWKITNNTGSEAAKIETAFMRIV